jgi:EmrB/QacA subfamily drug resistance transporter
MTLLQQQKPDAHEGSIMTITAVDRPAAAPAGDASRSKREVLEALSGLLLAMFVSILSATIVSNALPTIIADLHGSQTQYTWVVTATLLTTTASTPIWGKLADLFDKKLLVQIAIVIFVVSSAMAGLAQSMGWLIGWRAVQGIGAGGLQALAQVVIAALIPPRERGRYSGYLGAVLATATVSGPLIGGLLVDTSWLGWRWCFYVGVPIGVIALIVLQRTLHLPTVKRDVKLDYLGATLIAGGVSTLLIWISLAGSQFAWGSVTSLTLAGFGIAALVAAVIVELRVPEPVVPMNLFRNRTVVLAVLGSIVLGLVMFGGSVFLGQYFQVARGYAPTEAGLLTLPLVGGLMIASTVSGQLISRYGRWKGFLVAGAILTTAGLALLSTMDHTTSIPLLGVYLGVLGLGVGMSMQNLVLAVQNTVDVTEIGSASSLVAFLRSMGGTIGVTVLGIVLSHRVSALLGVSASGTSAGTSDLSHLDAAAAAAVRAAYGDAIGRVFLIAAIGSILTLVAVAFIKEVPLRTTVGRAPEAAPAAEAVQTVEVGETTAPVDDPAITVRELPAAGDGHLPRHAAADSQRFGHRNGQPDNPRSGEALAALDDVERAAHDLADARGRMATSVDRLRAAGFGQQQIDGLLARRIAEGTARA